jgi:DNA-binding NarL/FixJ family response regulator
MIRTLITDDHPVLRNGLKSILVREFEGLVCGEAANAEEALTRVEQEHWDLIILDISMPGRSGLEALKDLKRLRPMIPVLVMSVHPDVQYGRRALMAGASGYLNKDAKPEELVRAVRQLLSGNTYVSQTLADSLVSHLRPDFHGPLHQTLSDREFEIMLLLASGKTPTHIAEELHLNVTTISTYRARIMTKMNITTTSELMFYALSNRLVE